MYPFLINAAKVIEWARSLVTTLNRRDAEVAKRLADIEARLTAGGL
jgi:hypothetical protein